MKTFTRNLALAALPALALAQSSCPSMTAVAQPPCSTCVRPLCLRVETITIPASCACQPLATVTSVFPTCGAPNACDNLSCETSYAVISPAIGCPTSSSGTPSSTGSETTPTPTGGDSSTHCMTIGCESSSTSIPPVDMPTVITSTTTRSIETGSVTCLAIGCNNGTLPTPSGGQNPPSSTPPVPAGAAAMKAGVMGAIGGVGLAAVGYLL